MFNYKMQDAAELQWVEIAPEADLPNGERLFVEIDRTAIVVFNIAGGLYAIADLCSHDDGPLGDGEVRDFAVTCPRHGAAFDVRTGKVLALPATEDIPAYPTRVHDGQIEVGLPR
jgi:3-phenylpropionate/trans-cinnamate dioxygenase ferredoxin subunit